MADCETCNKAPRLDVFEDDGGYYIASCKCSDARLSDYYDDRTVAKADLRTGDYGYVDAPTEAEEEIDLEYYSDPA